MTMSRSNSRSSRSWMISRCSRPEKAAAEAQAQGRAALGLVLEAGIVEAQLAQAVAQIAVVVGVGRVHAAEHDRLARAEAGQRVPSAGLRSSVIVSPTRASPISLMAAVMKPTSPGPSVSISSALGVNTPTRSTRCAAPVPMKRTFWPFCERAVLDPDQRHDAEIAVVPGIDDQRLQRRLGVALRAAAGAGRSPPARPRRPARSWPRSSARPTASRPMMSSICCFILLGLGRRQVDLVQHRHDLEIGVDRLVGVGQRLRLDTLGRVDQQQGALAGAHRAADLVGEVDVAGRVDQVEDVVLARRGPCISAGRTAP